MKIHLTDNKCKVAILVIEVYYWMPDEMWHYWGMIGG